MFNQFANATTFVSINNLPIVAGTFKNTLLGMNYANNTPWYEKLKGATSCKDIFDTMNVSFTMVDNNKFYPVIKNVDSFSYKSVLENLAPYMADGNLYVQDDFHYYTIKFENGKISGSRRKVEDGNPLTTTTPPVTTTPVKTTDSTPATTTTPVKATKSSPKTSAKPKKYGKTQVRTSTKVAAIQAREDGRYTVQELVRELLRQMDNGNGNKYVEVKADFLFKNEKYA